MNKMPQMPREEAFTKRSQKIYDGMRWRLKEKRWKSGRRQGMVRVVGRGLSFSKEQFRDWLLAQLGGNPDGVAQCKYCRRPLTALDLNVDHVVPISRSGALTLENLAVCDDLCNRWKGKLTADEFQVFMDAMDKLLRSGALKPAGYDDIMNRLKGQILKFKPKEKESNEKPKRDPVPIVGELFVDDSRW